MIEEKLKCNGIDADANGISFHLVASPDVAYEFGLAYPSAKEVEIIIDLALCCGEVLYECHICPLILDVEGFPVETSMDEIKLKKKDVERLLYKALFEKLQKEELLNSAEK